LVRVVQCLTAMSASKPDQPEAAEVVPIGSAAVSLAADAAVIALTGELTIYHAAERARLLLARLDGTTLALDLGGVTAVDLAGVQLLLLVEREARARGVTLRLQRPSPPVCDVIDRFQLSALRLLAAPASAEVAS
jgi:anti-sigma B factor antagonist